jgi:hypothetical protein
MFKDFCLVITHDFPNLCNDFPYLMQSLLLRSQNAHMNKDCNTAYLKG